jgi:hypothetical protein
MVLSKYREAIQHGRAVRWEEESVYPAGRRHGEVAVTPLYDANGAATRLIGIVHDITERKSAEAALTGALVRGALEEHAATFSPTKNPRIIEGGLRSTHGFT